MAGPEPPDYDLLEFVLAGLFVGAAGAALVYAGAAVLARDWAGVSEGVGLGLMFLAGLTHPRRYVMDCLTFPLSFFEDSGRETSLTVVVGWLGFALWLGGFAVRWLG